jgi:hypothetical protein
MCLANEIEKMSERWGTRYTETKPSRFSLIEAFERENGTGLRALLNPANGDAEYPKGYLGNSLWGAYAKQK